MPIRCYGDANANATYFLLQLNIHHNGNLKCNLEKNQKTPKWKLFVQQFSRTSLLRLIIATLAHVQNSSISSSFWCLLGITQPHFSLRNPINPTILKDFYTVPFQVPCTLYKHSQNEQSTSILNLTHLIFTKQSYVVYLLKPDRHLKDFLKIFTYLAAPGLTCSMQSLQVEHVGCFSCEMWAFSCGTWHLVPHPGIKPRPPALGGWSLSHWTTREVLKKYFFDCQILQRITHGTYLQTRLA